MLNPTRTRSEPVTPAQVPPGPPPIHGGFRDLSDPIAGPVSSSQSNRVAIPWTSIVTSSHLLDPRFPHDRGLSNRCVPGPGSPSDVVGGSSGTALTEHEFQCTWPTVPSRDGGSPWSPNQAHYYPLSAAVNGSSKAASLNKKTTEHGRGPPPLSTTFPGLQSRLPHSPLRRRGRLLQDRRL